MFKKFSLRSLIGKMLLASSLAVVMATIPAVVSTVFVKKTSQVSEELADLWVPSVGKIEQIRTDLARYRGAEWELISAVDEAGEKRANDRMDELSGEIFIYSKTYSELLKSDASIAKFDEFKAKCNEYFNMHEELAKMVKEKKRAEAEKLLTTILDDKFNKVLGIIDEMATSAYNGAVAAKGDAEQMSALAFKIILVLIPLGIFLGLGLAYWVGRSASRNLDAIVEKLAENAGVSESASTQLTAVSTSLSEASTEQAAAVEQTMVALDEINATVTKNAELSRKTDERFSESQKAANRGKETIQDMVVAMDEIKASNQSVLSEVEASHEQISEIVVVISEIEQKTKIIYDIVFQTKLLAFNASVEAARAGEHGKGFAVVAEEVGNLAAMSGGAAKEISDLIASSVTRVQEIVTTSSRNVQQLTEVGRSKIENGITTTQRCSDALGDVLGAMGEVSLMVQEMAGASKEQALGIQEISNSMSQIDNLTQRNNNLASDTSDAAHESARLGAEIVNVISDLERVLRGSVQKPKSKKKRTSKKISENSPSNGRVATPRNGHAAGSIADRKAGRFESETIAS